MTTETTPSASTVIVRVNTASTPACLGENEDGPGNDVMFGLNGNDVMLPAGTGVRVPGALRLAIARASRVVDAPPFGSLAAFSTALERFERGDRADAIRQLLSRGTVPATTAQPQDERPERRRNNISVAALRRELRQADARVFELRNQMNELPVQQLPHFPLEPLPSHQSWALASVAAVLLSFVVGYAATLVVERRMTPSTSGSGSGPALERHSDRPTPDQQRPAIAQEGAEAAASDRATPVGTSERTVERSR